MSSPERLCPVCGDEIQRRPGEKPANWRRRKTCGHGCAVMIAASARTALGICSEERLERVRQLTAAGESPSQIAATLGIKVNSLGRWLSRMGLHDLARPFHRVGTNGGKNVRRRCGTRQAYLDHGKHGEPTDDQCKAANNAYMAKRREREAAGIHPVNVRESGTPPILIKPAEWTSKAECAKYDPTWWDGDDLRKAAQAAAICRQCPVAAECLAEGIALRERHGMRAGEFPADWKLAS